MEFNTDLTDVPDLSDASPLMLPRFGNVGWAVIEGCAKMPATIRYVKQKWRNMHLRILSFNQAMKTISYRPDQQKLAPAFS